MFDKTAKITTLVLAGTLALATPALSQTTDASELTAEELEELFNNQKTRGLVLAPAEDDETEAPADTGTTTVVADADDYVQFDPSEQVNIQITFDFDSAALREDQKPKLTTLCQVMNAVDVEVFRIVGHTDASGSADYNERLSLLRAQEVKRFLVSDCGIDANRLEAVGVGESFLFDQTDPNGDINRRVEFQALG